MRFAAPRPLSPLAFLTATTVSLASAAAQEELARFDGAATGDWFGHAIACFDMDGDGLAETSVGAPRGDGLGGPFGYVQVFAGSDGSLMHTFLGEPGPSGGGWFGGALDRAGDVDHDGYEDLIAGAQQNTVLDLGLDTGYARVYSGRTGEVVLHLDGIQVREAFGQAVAGLGDINGDGHSDLAVGAFRYNDERGAVRVFSGLDGSLLYTKLGASAGDQFGWTVAGVGDANGDLVPDFAVGAPKARIGGLFTGTVRLYSGSTGAQLGAWHGDDDYDQLGASVGAAGDIDGDGLRDVAAGMIGDSSQGTLTGAVRAFSHPNGVLFTVLGEAALDWMGAAVAEAGDVNRDGHDDLWVGSRAASLEATFSGAVYLVSGADASFMWRVTGDADHDRLGQSIAGGPDVDVNGDGIPDLASGGNQEISGGPGHARIFSSNSAEAATYCTAKVNSQGCTPAIGWSGTPSFTSVDPFTVTAEEVLNHQSGIFFYGFAEAAIPFQGALLCVAAPHTRTPVQDSGGSDFPTLDCSGTYAHELNAVIQFGTDTDLFAGREVLGQFWSRDPQDAFGTGLTDGVRFVIQP